MTKPVTHQDAPNTMRDSSSTEFDNPSDCCDFGYDLLVSSVQLQRDGVGEAKPMPQFDRHPQFDPVDHWGKG